MKGLCIKDIRLLLKQKTFFLVIIFLSVFNGMNLKNIAIVPSLMIFFLVSLVFTTITYDEMDHGLSFLFTLPISRKKYVGGKYLLSMGIVGLALLVSLGIIVVMNKVQNQSIAADELLVILGFVCLLGLLYMSLLMPIYFKFGAEQSRLILILVIGTILFFSFAGSYLIEKLGINLVNKLNAILTQPIWLLVLVSLIIAAVAVALSYGMSVSIMKKKEL